MDIVELMDKNKRLGRAFYLYALFTLVNLCIHVANYYQGFLPDFGDYALYLVKIAVCLFVLITFGKNRLARYQGVTPIMRMMLCLDITELVISLLITDIFQKFAVRIMLVPMIIKIILDFCLYLEIIKDKKDRKSWITVNLTLLILLLLSLKFGIWFLAFIAIIFRLVLSFVYIKTSLADCNIENAGISGDSRFSKWSGSKASVKAGVLIYTLIACMLMAFSFICLYIPEGKYELTSEDGSTVVHSTYDELFSVYFLPHRHEKEDREYKEYIVTSLLYKLRSGIMYTGFERKRVGLINVKTGEATKPIFKNDLYFDDNGLAYDYDGHFVDLNGNTVITLPYIARAKRSARTSIFNAAFAAVRGSALDKISDKEWDDLLYFATADDDSCVDWYYMTADRCNIKKYDLYFYKVDVNDFSFFHKNATVFYSEVKGAYGMMNDKGEIILEPCIYKYQYQDTELISAILRATGNRAVINQEGKILSEEKYD